MKILSFLTLLLALFTFSPLGQEKVEDPLIFPEDPVRVVDEKKRAVILEIKRRRESRDTLQRKIDHQSATYDLIRNGAVHQGWPTENTTAEDWIIRNHPLGQASAAYSTMVGKEIMVSSKVADRRINLNILQASPQKAAREFEKALAQLQVEIIELSDDISVLVDSLAGDN